MKKLTLFVCSVLLLQIEGYLIQVPTTTVDTRIVNSGWLHIQKLLLPLFENVCETSTDPLIVRLDEEFKLDPTNGFYLKPEVINNLQTLQSSKGLLPKGNIFSEYNIDHLNELKVIFEVLYYAKDLDTFFKAACWARQNVNCGLFVDAIYLAIITRRDTENFLLPAPYEILPNYFIRKDFLIKASSILKGEDITPSQFIRDEGNAYILDVNYTTNYYDESDDKLAYFHEDVSLNSYYFLTKLKNSPWLDSSINLKKMNNGQNIYHLMKQIMARYNLERYSNGLPELDGLDWDNFSETAYDPMLIYSNGHNFNQVLVNLIGNEIIPQLKRIENNLQVTVMHMRNGGYNKSEILDHLMQILVTDEGSYENLALQMFNNNGAFDSSPSVFGHYMTMARDPIFWKLNKKMVDMVDNAIRILPGYTKSELYFPGVEVQNIEVRKIMTSYDNFVYDITDAMKTTTEDTKFQIKISQPRLNHKPFAFKINISSLVAQKALVKLYIGPKVMPGQLVEKKNFFMLLDCFETNLKLGSNILTRSSLDITNVSEDFTSLRTIHKKVIDAEFGVTTVPFKSVWSQIGFPNRLILPKGTTEGLPLQVFVFVAPYVKATVGGSRMNLELNSAILSPGYPLDLDIEIQQLFNLPNALVKDVTITNKVESTSYNRPSSNMNGGSFDRVWQNSETNLDNTNSPLYLSARPTFTKKFDYKSKKNQYGKKEETTKTDEIKYPDAKPQDIDVTATEKIVPDVINDTEPENVEVINNIYINPDLEFKTNKVNDHENENLVYKVILDKDISTETIKGNETEDVQVSKIVEIYEKDDDNAKSHGLLGMPRKRFSNIFNIVFKPLKVETDSREKLYE